MRASLDFESKVQIFTETLQSKDSRGILDDLEEVIGRYPASRETIHALALALAKLPIDDLGMLSAKIENRIKSLSSDIECKAWEVLKKLDLLRSEKEQKSARIDSELHINHQPRVGYLSLHLANCEAILLAISWVHDPPLEK